MSDLEKKVTVSSGGDFPISREFGRILLLLGFMAVLLSRGCDSIASRKAKAANANRKAAQASFNDEYDDAMSALPNDAGIEKKAALQKEWNQKRSTLEKGDWRKMKIAARKAETSYAGKSYWLEWLFLIGTLVFVTGLTGSAFASSGAERWASLIMLAIITVSIYIGGVAWVTSVVSSVKP